LPVGDQLSYQFWCFCNFLSWLMDQYLLDRPRYLATWIVMVLVVDTGVRAPSVYRVWISYSFPFGRYNTISLLSLIDLVTLTFEFLTLKMVRLIAHGVRNLGTNFGVSGTFRSRVIGQHLSDASRDLATLSYDIGDHGACCLCTKFEVRRPSRSEDIRYLLCEH